MPVEPDKFSRYRALVSAAAQRILGVGAVGGGGASGGAAVLGDAPAGLLLNDDASLYPALAAGFRELATLGRAAGAASLPPFADAQGHRRELYHPLVLHLHLAAFTRRYESMPSATWGACDEASVDAVLPCRRVGDFAETPPPSREVDVVLWHALCLTEQARQASRDADLELTDAVIHQALAQPGPGGALHAMEGDEPLDTWTYSELAGLHALARLALIRRNKSWARRVEEVAVYHLQNTQPDNATNQPWGLFAFVWCQGTASFAEQQLHDVAAHVGPAGGEPFRGMARPGGRVSGWLLADAADAMADFLG